MQDYFQGRRRWFGCLALLFSCFITTGWIRSYSHVDEFDIGQLVDIPSSAGHILLVQSRKGLVTLIAVDPQIQTVEQTIAAPQSPSPHETGDSDDSLSEVTDGIILCNTLFLRLTEVVSVPYWIFVAPCTLVSAVLLISSRHYHPRPQAQRYQQGPDALSDEHHAAVHNRCS